MRSHRRLVWNSLSSGLLLYCGTAAVEAQTPLQQLEQSVQTLPLPSAVQPAAAVEPGYLGIVADDVTAPTKGVQLMEVLADGPAHAGGLQVGDYVTSIDGQGTATLDEMAAILGKHPAGDQVTFIIRRGQEVLRADVTLGKRPPPEQRKFGNFGRIGDPNAATVVPAQPGTTTAPSVDPKMIPPEPPSELPTPGPRVIPHPGDYATPTLGPQPTPPSLAAVAAAPVAPPSNDPPPLLGVRAVPITPEMQVSLNLPEPRGALIVEVRPNSPAHRAGLPLEAVIVAVDAKRINSPTELSAALAARGVGASVKLSFFRYGQLSERTIKLGEGGPPPALVAPEAPPVAAPLAEAPSETAPVNPGPVNPGPTVAPPQNKVVPPPPAPALPPSVIAPPAATSSTSPIVTPVPANAPPSKEDNETDTLRLRIRELEAKLAEAEAKLKADEASEKKNEPKEKK